MADKMAQHKNQLAYVRYDLPNSKNNEFPVLAPPRAEGEKFKSNSPQAIQQRVYAAVCEMWSSFDANYFIKAVNMLNKELLPRLPKGYTNLAFRLELVDSEGKVIGGSGHLDGRGKLVNMWLTWKEVQAKIALRKTAHNVARLAVAVVKPTETVEPISFGWMNPKQPQQTATKQKASK